MSYFTVSSSVTPHNPSLGDCLDEPEPTATTVLLADLKHLEELDFDETDVLALFALKKKKSQGPHVRLNHVKYVDTGRQRL